jgi:membrane-associated phospholipid phosphatase
MTEKNDIRLLEERWAQQRFKRRCITAVGLMVLGTLIALFEYPYTQQIMVALAKATDRIEDLMDIVQHFGATWGIVLSVVLIYLLDRKRRQSLKNFLVGALVCSLAVNSLKLILRRQRPDFNRRSGDYEPLGDPDVAGRWFLMPAEDEGFFEESTLSFPSGHSAAAAYLAMALSTYYPRARYVWWAFAIGTMISRVTKSRHYLGDTIAGCGLGILVFIVVHRAGWGLGWGRSSGKNSPRSSVDADAQPAST